MVPLVVLPHVMEKAWSTTFSAASPDCSLLLHFLLPRLSRVLDVTELVHLADMSF